MTDILNMIDDELAIAAAKAFAEGPGEHHWHRMPRGFKRCTKCDLKYRDFKDQPCSHPDPPDVTDWNVAMRLKNKVLSNADRFGDGMIAVYYFENPEFKPNDTDEAVQLKFASHYFAAWATPQGYIKAALLALKGD